MLSSLDHMYRNCFLKGFSIYNHLLCIIIQNFICQISTTKTVGFRFQVLDYALLEGDHANDLKIRSFFQFVKNKYTNHRLVTTMLDTISCFVGYDNLKPLYEHPKVVGECDQVLQYS